MEQNSQQKPKTLWQAFAATGRIEDYLLYRAAENAVREEGVYADTADNRGTDHPREQ